MAPSSVWPSYLIPACCSQLTWKKNNFPGGVSRAASAAATTAAGANWKLNPGSTIHVPSPVQFTPPSSFLPGCIRRQTEGWRQACPAKTPPKKTSFGLPLLPERNGVMGRRLFQFSSPFVLRPKVFTLIPQQKKVTLLLTQLCGMSRNV